MWIRTSDGDYLVVEDKDFSVINKPIDETFSIGAKNPAEANWFRIAKGFKTKEEAQKELDYIMKVIDCELKKGDWKIIEINDAR